MHLDTTERQYPKYVAANFTVATAAEATIKLPPGSLVVGGGSTVVTGATGTSPTITATDNASAPFALINAGAVSAAGTVAALAAGSVGRYYPAGATITFTTGGTAPAGGEFIVNIGYIIVGFPSAGANELYRV